MCIEQTHVSVLPNSEATLLQQGKNLLMREHVHEQRVVQLDLDGTITPVTVARLNRVDATLHIEGVSEMVLHTLLPAHGHATQCPVGRRGGRDEIHIEE